MKKNKLLSYFNYASFIGAILLSIYVLADMFLIRSKLPADVCPVTKNRPLLYVAIGLCLISFILSFFESKAKKKRISS